MIIEGLKLTVIGMGVVFSFLILIVIVIQITYQILKKTIISEEKFISTKNVATQRIVPRISDFVRAKGVDRIPVVIAAAIAAYRDRNRALKR